MTTVTRERIRVMRVIARMNVGGPAVHIGVLTAGLDPRRYESLTVYGAIGPGEQDMADVLGDTPVVYIPELGRAVRPFNDLVALIKLLRVVHAFKPHILHTHTAKAGALGRVAGALYGLYHPRRRIRLIHTYHGHVFTGYFAPWQQTLIRLVERMLGLVTSRVVCISPRQAADLVERYRIVPRRIVRIVPLGFDLSRLLRLNRQSEGLPFRREVGARTDDVVVGFVGRLVAIKNPLLLLRALHLARDQGAHSLKLVVVGGGDLEEDVKREVDRLGLSASVHFTGWRRDLAQVYAGLDIVVLCSNNEGTPVSLIEAMAAGCVAVGTAVGGVPDVIRDGETGALVPPNDPNALAAVLVHLAGAPVVRQALGEAGRVAVGIYDRRRLLADTEALYSECLASSPQH